MTYCSYTWSELVQVNTRRPHMMRLKHRCILTTGHNLSTHPCTNPETGRRHMHKTQPTPHRCACQPVDEFHTDRVLPEGEPK